MKSTIIFLTVSQAPSAWYEDMQLSPLVLSTTVFNYTIYLIITASSVKCRPFKSLKTHSLGLNQAVSLIRSEER